MFFAWSPGQPHCDVDMWQVNRATTFLLFYGLKVVRKFLIADLPDVDIVLKIDFLSRYEPKLQWCKRIITMADPLDSTEKQHVSAINENPRPVIHSTLTQLVTMQEFASACTMDCDDGDIWLAAQLRLTESVSNDVAPLGKGSDNPKTSAILNRFRNVLVSQLPAGLPQESRAVGGTVIEHTMELDPSRKPFAAQPRPLTVEEDAELKILLEFSQGMEGSHLVTTCSSCCLCKEETRSCYWYQCIAYVCVLCAAKQSHSKQDCLSFTWYLFITIKCF
jgi:hypothetical protein